jgi:putative ABC transport system permease protein
VLTLGLGMGATTAMFSLVDGVVLEPLPYPDPDQLVTVEERTAAGSAQLASYLNFADWRAEATTVSSLAAYTPARTVTARVGGSGVRARLTSVSADFFEVAGLAPVLGRLPGPGENRPGGPPVAVVSHGFWRDALEAPESLAGATVGVRGQPYEVVGVLPPDFDLPHQAEIWLPLDRAVPWTVRGNSVVAVVGRLRPGVALASARRDLDAVHREIASIHAEVESVGVEVTPLHEEVVGETRGAMVLLLGASGFLLLVACANVASTLLARGPARRREMAIRTSLGAGRGHLVRQLLVESLVLAGFGAMAALGLARGILWAARRLDPGTIPRLTEVGLDGRVLLFTGSATVVTALIFGLLPALRLTGSAAARGLRSGARWGTGRTTRTTWTLLVAAEVALAVVLLSGSGLLLRSFGEVLSRDGGFRTSGVVSGRIHLPPGEYATAAEAVGALDRLLDDLGSRPGVDEAGMGLLLPVRGTGSVGSPVTPEGRPRTGEVFQYRVADAGYFRTLGIPLLRGRLFDETDREGTPHVAVVDEAFAASVWPGEDPVGKRFDITGMDPYRNEWITVIGVVGEVRDWTQDPGSNPTYYVSYAQRPAFLATFGASIVAAGPRTGPVATAIRDAVREADSGIPVRVQRLGARIADSAGERRFTALVLGGFALLAWVLAAVGVYGVVSYTVARRTREVGIRLALGARPASLRAGVQIEALRVVVAGAAVGLTGAVALALTLRSMLFHVSPADPVSLLGGAAALVGAGWLAAWIPARRATRIDPSSALRAE